MNWDPEKLRDDFLVVAKLGGIKINPDDIDIEILEMPHKPPAICRMGKWQYTYSPAKNAF